MWEVVSYVYVDDFEHLDQPERNLFLHSILAQNIYLWKNALLWCAISSPALI